MRKKSLGTKQKPLPPIKHTRHAILAQPATTLPVSEVITAQRIPIKLSRLIMMPQNVIKRIGLIDRLEIPSKANASIFFRG